MRRSTEANPSDSAGKRPWAGRLVKNAVALMISAGGTAVLGVAFWGFAARLATQSAVGRASAEIATMILLASFAQLSFGSIFERFLPVAGTQTRRFVVRAYVMCVVFALVVTSIYAFSGLSHHFLANSFLWRSIFVLAVVSWTIFALQDSVLIGLRASRWVPVENIVFGIIKLALLPVLIANSPKQGVFLAWSAPVILTLIVVNWYLFAKRIPEHEAIEAPAESLPRTKELILLAGAQYATLLFTVLTPYIVTLIVIARLGAVASAHYYVPALIVFSISIFLLSISRSFVVEAASEPHALRRHTNMAIGAMTVVLVPSVVIGVIFAPYILHVFGPGYEAHSTTLLRMLLLSLPMGAISLFYSAFAWLDRRVWWMAMRDLISGVIYFCVLFWLIGRHGIDSIGIASLISSTTLGIFFLPISIRRYRLTTNYETPRSDGTATSPAT
jgi:O-antigen/teichoic acid export membrane protein